MKHRYLITNDLSADRRKFLIQSMKMAGAMALTSLAHAEAHISPTSKKSYTVQDIMDLVLKEGKLTPIKDTVDTLKSGSPDQQVTGIITTMFATITVIEEAAKRNANFIIAHEPTFYNHRDDLEWVPNNAVVKQKKALLDKHKIAIWRFHDYCHSLTPDQVLYGVAKKLNWTSYYPKDETTFTIPAITLENLAQHLKKSLGIKQLRVIGDLKKRCERISLMPGASGGKGHVTAVEKDKPDVLIVGELSEWETAEYVRDSNLLGGKTALIILGHAVSEEPGMELFVDWLQPKLEGIKVTHIASGDPFTWL
ncbi:Nif3-like dinuclear metal center hexameric protein [Dyadobacter sp. CY326]|uniref:Nif3-like dinuclear metal center hexameric protein n=1 Tax=Dyadobacter sp. CY326 TaxID=2907300 RepID=UPI001F2D2B6E|nr:Nif3-like dinuclear metal center hexameric protein [Dyadobacter sp. CY326]MCE7064634.1 Nif3-like dinuclear metal center hexameric protein [Dyadobacter sp. CY326]